MSCTLVTPRKPAGSLICIFINSLGLICGVLYWEIVPQKSTSKKEWDTECSSLDCSSLLFCSVQNFHRESLTLVKGSNHPARWSHCTVAWWERLFDYSTPKLIGLEWLNVMAHLYLPVLGIGETKKLSQCLGERSRGLGRRSIFLSIFSFVTHA